jgi:O-antigen ligase
MTTRPRHSWQALFAAIGIVVLWIVVPIVLGKGLFRHLPLAWAVGTTALGVAGLATALADGRATPGRRWTWLGALLLVGGSLAPLAAGVALERGFFLDRLALLCGALAAYFGARAFFASGRNRALRDLLPWFVLATLGLHLAAGCWRFFVRGEARMTGFVLQPNFFATIVAALALPLVLPALRENRRDPRFLLAVAALLVALVCSGSRAALGIALVAALSYVAASPAGRRLGAWVGGAAVVLVLALMVIPNPLKKRLESDVDRSFPRPFIWERAAGIATEHPLGVGLGMHRWFFARDAWIEAETSLSGRRHEIGIAHNVVLGAAAESGVAGAIGVITLIGAFLALGRRTNRRSFRPQARAWYCGALVLLLHAQVDGVAQSQAALGVLGVLAGAAESRLVSRTNRVRGQSHRVGAAIPVAVLAVAALVLASAPILLHVRVAQHLRAAAIASGEGDLAAARAGYESVVTLIGDNSPAALGLIEVARRETDAKSESWSLLPIEVAIAAAIRANPHDAKPYVMLGDARRARHFAERRTDRHLLRAALDAYSRAIVADPLALAVRMMRARVLRDLGDPEGAIADLREVLRLEPRHPPAHQAWGDVEMELGNRDAAIEQWFAAVNAYLAAHELFSDGRYGALPYLIEIVSGFDPKTCEEKIYAAQQAQ